MRWVQTEDEQIKLNLVYIKPNIWQDIDGKYWFNDETQADVFGPFKTVEEAEAACLKYAKTL